MQLTNEQKRIKIAEACGWRIVQANVHTMHVWEPGAESPARLGLNLENKLPDYLNDLNAMHEAEKVLDGSQIDEYKHRLKIVVTDKERISQCATATQRAEAFGRTLNLW